MAAATPTAALPEVPAATAAAPPDATAVQELVAMGFAASLAAEALRRKQGNVQDAVQLLLDHPEGVLPPEDSAPPPPPPPLPPAASAAAAAATAAAEPSVGFGAGAGGAPVAVAQPFGVAPTYTFAAAPAYVPSAQPGYGAPPPPPPPPPPPQQQQSAYPAHPTTLAYPVYTPAAATGYGGAASPYGAALPASVAAPHPSQGMPTFAVPVTGYRPPHGAGLQPAGPQTVGIGVGVGAVSYQPTNPAEWAAYARAPLGAGPGATPPGQQFNQQAQQVQQTAPQGQPGQPGQPPSYTPPTSGYRV